MIKTNLTNWHSLLSIIFFFISTISLANESNSFLIVSPKTTSQLIVNENEEPLVHTTSKLFSEDVFRVSNKKLEITTLGTENYQIKVGTIGISDEFDMECIKEGIDIESIRDKWETFIIQSVNSSDKNQKKLFIIGSQSRATAFGLMELSRMIGVSPWYWWADVIPEKKATLELPQFFFLKDGPKVKYRGIFLNDEDWGLQPWAAKTFEPEVGDIGPKTYEKIFELLIRLKANTIWPAMHPCTQAFYTIPGNQEMAAKYQIYIGTSHAEPMLRNNVDEWNHDKYGDYNYATNAKSVKSYWQKRIEELNKDDNYIVTLGMRGIHDSGMQGDFTSDQKVKMLETIISDQRRMLSAITNKDILNIPQAFVPYKEVLEIYRDGAKIPDDVTLVWPDDNHGYIRQLSNLSERNRSGGAGVYYHISYWGRPHDYLWLESVPVSLIWEEMNKAYHTNAKNIWIVNVGDIKPNEIGMNFFLDMAWNPDQFVPESLNSYYTKFAEEQFGEIYSDEIGEILTKYFQLGFSRKPEHLGLNGVYPNTPINDPELSLYNNGDEVQKRIDAYTDLERKVQKIYKELPEYLQNAFYQLVVYKILSASNMNKKILYAYKSRVYAQQERVSANEYAQKAKNAFQQIQETTKTYNQLSDGKWNYMMQYNPRELPVFYMPSVGSFIPTQNIAGKILIEGNPQPLLENNLSTLPTFYSSTNRKYFVDICNSGNQPIPWNIESDDDWIKISSKNGLTKTDQRIWISINWEKLHENGSNTSKIKVKVDTSEYYVKVNAQNLVSENKDKLFVEDNDVISIEAEHYSSLEDDSINSWKVIQGLGRENDAIGSFPIYSEVLSLQDKHRASLKYNFVNHSIGDAVLRFYCLPSHPINENYKLRFYVTIDNDKPIIIDASLKDMNEHNEAWKTNVLRAVNIIESKASILKKGNHQLKISMIDPGVVIDKIEIVFGKTNKMNTYFGSVETIHK